MLLRIGILAIKKSVRHCCCYDMNAKRDLMRFLFVLGHFHTNPLPFHEQLAIEMDLIPYIQEFALSFYHYCRKLVVYLAPIVAVVMLAMLSMISKQCITQKTESLANLCIYTNTHRNCSYLVVQCTYYFPMNYHFLYFHSLLLCN